MKLPKIEKNVPLAKSRKKEVSERIELIINMDIGDSFVIDKKDGAKYFHAFKKAKAEYVCRSISQNEYRIWKSKND